METTESPVVTAKVKNPSKKKRIIAVAAVLIVMVGVAGGAYYFLSRPEPVPINPGDSVPSQLNTLTSEEIDSLADEEVNASEDFARAHAKALAQSQKGDYTASATTYKALVDTGKANHELYVEYAAALYYGGDKQGGIRAMETAIEKVKSSNTSQADKDSILKLYNNYLSGYRGEAN